MLINLKSLVGNETLDNWSIDETPASPPTHEKMSNQNVRIYDFNANNVNKWHCIELDMSVTKLQPRSKSMTSQKIITSTSDLDLIISLMNCTHFSHLNSSTVFSDINYRVVPNIPMLTLPPTMYMEAIIKPPKNNNTNDTPTSPPYHEILSHQYFPIVTSLTDRGIHLDYSTSITKKQDKDERMNSQKTMPNTSNLDNKHSMNLTHSPLMNSSTIFFDINYISVSDIPMPSSLPAMYMEATIKSPENKIMISNDSPESSPYHEKLPHQNFSIGTSLKNRRHYINNCRTKKQDTNKRRILQKIMPTSNDLDHKNLMNSTHPFPMDSPTVFSGIMYQAPSNSPVPSKPLAFATIDNFKSVDMDLRYDDETTKSNLDQNHPVLTPPLSLTSDLDHSSAPDVVDPWDQLLQKWSNENERNNVQPQQKLLQHQQQHFPKHWKYPNQCKKKPNLMDYQYPLISNKWLKHDPRDQLKENILPSGKRGKSNWTKDSNNFNQYSRPSDHWNQRPYFLSKKEQPW